MFERKWTFFLELFWNLSFSMKSISSSKFLIIWWIQEKPLSMFCWKSIWINKVLKLAKKNNKTNKTLQTPTKRKANQAETRFSAFHWITVCFLVKSSLWFYPNFALSVITYHITCYIRMRSERHFPYEKIVLNDGFP